MPHLISTWKSKEKNKCNEILFLCDTKWLLFINPNPSEFPSFIFSVSPTDQRFLFLSWLARKIRSKLFRAPIAFFFFQKSTKEKNVCRGFLFSFFPLSFFFLWTQIDWGLVWKDGLSVQAFFEGNIGGLRKRRKDNTEELFYSQFLFFLENNIFFIFQLQLNQNSDRREKSHQTRNRNHASFPTR